VAGRTRRCDESVIQGRLKKAEQFWDAAELVREHADDEAEVGDAYATLCVHAGIAASDVLCCIALREHAIGENHSEALALLRKVRPDGDRLSNALDVLLGMKTIAGYDAAPVSAADRKRGDATPSGS
jgi:hypothetical protein